MVPTTNYSLVPEGHQVPNYRGESEFVEFFKSTLAEEIAALQAFYLYQTSPDEAAQAISRPISNSSAPNLGDYGPEIVALCNLWDVLVDALIE